MENREILQFDLKQLTSAGELFHRLSKIDPDNVPDKYGTSIEDARKLVEDNCTVRIVFERVSILDRTEDSVLISEGVSFRGTMPPRFLAESEELYGFVATLDGFSNIETSDMMIQYLTDTWGSAYIEAGQVCFSQYIKTSLAEEGLTRTHLWSPGQHSFDLYNQQPLFDLLHPEDIGCTLTTSMLMIPVKSSSGIFGVIQGDTEPSLKPCDFCQFQKNCPNSRPDRCISL